MKRRDVLKTALAAAPAAAAQQHGPEHAPAAAQAKPGTVNAATARKRLLFDDHQLQTVATVCDLIIPATDTPGARAAKVHDFIDLILNDGPAERRNRFLSGLGWVDGYAIRTHAKPFVRCSAAQQTAMLKAFMDAPAGTELAPGAAFFNDIKGLTTMGYYTSREGIAELNKGNRVPASFNCKSTGGRA
ncbi:MAG TPA: gluconate 2-dehydrogenase subunit 3 family protein [Bryobacteraceae bacterium]|nr:gluconate 2-dehydrogenase subunit 3 family protein [Bryobacteraceae bacterium]